MPLRQKSAYIGKIVPHRFRFPLLACGAQLKSNFCLAKDEFAYISIDFGDLEDFGALSRFEKAIKDSRKHLRIEPKLIACDLHPEYLSTKFALSFQSSFPIMAVQHHHAHIASCLAENSFKKKAIGVAFDGLGLGEDRALWGGEFLIVELSGFCRKGHLRYVPMAGGRQAIKQPWRMAVSWLYQIFGEDFLSLDIEFSRRLDRYRWKIVQKMINENFNSPATSSIGRLFDAVSSLVGLRDVVDFQAQAAIELEELLREEDLAKAGQYKFEIRKTEGDSFIIEPAGVFKAIVEDLVRNTPASIISARFHNAIVQMVLAACLKIRRASGLNKVALSGGVFQNKILSREVPRKLRGSGFSVLLHKILSPNDSSVCFGQAVVANACAFGNSDGEPT
jgi:hydrogenase maturation protein HypF